MTRARLLWISLILPVLLVIWLVWSTQIPLGVPGEWVWEREGLIDPWYLSMIPALIAGVVYMTFVWFGAPRFVRCSKAEAWMWLTGLAVGAFAWLCVVQECGPPLNQLSKAGYVLYFRHSSGYFAEARDEAADLKKYLAGYNTLMAKGDVYHIGTHPPGLAVVFRGLLELCRGSPGLTRFLNDTEPASVRAAFNDIASSTRRHELPLGKADRAALWLAFLLVQAAVALTVFPLYGLLRRGLASETCWLAVSLWPAVPSVATFLPKSDVLFAALGITLAWLWLASWRRTLRGEPVTTTPGAISHDPLAGQASSWVPSVFRWATFGALFWLGMTLSLALLPVAFLLGVATLWDVWSHAAAYRLGGQLLRIVVGVVVSLTVFLLCIWVAWQITGLNLIETWRWNYRNHAGFYLSNKRTYVAWLLVNPLEFAIAAGPPLVILAVASIALYRRSARTLDAGISAALLLTWAILWLTGKNMGEAARLWTFLTPWLIIPAARTLSQGTTGTTSDSSREKLRSQMQLWRIACACQLIVNVAVVMRVPGFPLPIPLAPG